MDSCFYIPLECLYFLIISPYYGNSIYPCFGNYVLEIVWIFASREIFKKFIIFECWFSHTFPVLWESTFPMFWELYGFLLHAKYVRNPDFGIFFSPYFFRTIGIHFPHVLETMLLMWKLFRSYFHSNIYVKLFTKLSYFVSDSLSAFQIPLSQKYGNIYSTEK